MYAPTYSSSFFPETVVQTRFMAAAAKKNQTLRFFSCLLFFFFFFFFFFFSPLPRPLDRSPSFPVLC
jgi:hypothetical protein